MKQKRWKSQKLIPYMILSVLAILFILPLLWVLAASFNAHASQSLQFPQTLTLEHYKNVSENPSNRLSFAVGLSMSLSQAALTVVLAGLAAYPLSRYEMRYNRLFLYTILFMNALPITAVMVPVYKLFISLGIYDKNPGVVLFFTASSLPYGIWMMKNFMDNVPLELEEAAWVDGATYLQCLLKIVAPLMLPGICVVAIFTFSGSWGNFFVPYILLNTPEKFPASIRLYQFMGSYGQISYGPLAAYSVLYSAPSILLYILSQRYMSKGFHMGGATKG